MLSRQRFRALALGHKGERLLSHDSWDHFDFGSGYWALRSRTDLGSEEEVPVGSR